MEGSGGTVYGWCEIERDAYGNVVARHIYLNDEVLARLIGDRVVRKHKKRNHEGSVSCFVTINSH